MKTHVWIIRIFGLLVFSLTSHLLSAQFETDFGFPANNESYWDGIQYRRNRALSLVNTSQNNSNSLLLSRHNLVNGGVQNTTRLFLDDRRLLGRSLGLSSGFPGFFVTGKIQPNSPPATILSGAFILRTTPGLAPTHFFLRPEGPIEEGVAVETYGKQSFFVGNSRPALLDESSVKASFWVTSFGGKMGVLWSNRYLLTTHDGNDFIVRESCLGYYRKGNSTPRRGLAVTGSYGRIGEPGVRHAFISMIDQTNGIEIWRTACPSELSFDEGLDLVYDPSQGLYFIVGQAVDPNNTLWLYTAVVRDNGAFLGSSIHAPGQGSGIQDVVARDVCLSLTKDHAIITGFVEVAEQGSDPVERTFAAEMNIQPDAPTLWSRYYLESESEASNVRSSEAVQRLRRAPGGPGYLITTGGKLKQAATNTRDAQLIKVRPDGMLGLPSCEVLDFKLEPRLQRADPPVFHFSRESFPWQRVPVPLQEQVDLNVSSCADMD